MARRGWIYEVADEFWATVDSSRNANAEVPSWDPFGPEWRAAAARAAEGLGPGPNTAAVPNTSGSQHLGSGHSATDNAPVHGPQPVTNWASRYDSYYSVTNNVLVRVPHSGSRPVVNVAAPGTSSGHSNESAGGTSHGGQPPSFGDRAHWSGPFGPFYYRHSDGAVALNTEAVKYIWDEQNPRIGSYHEAGPTQNYLDNPLANTPAIESGPAYPENTSTNTLVLENTNLQPIGMASSAGAANFSHHTAGPNSTANSVSTASLHTNSTEYRGDPNILENMSADIPEDENTSLYVCGMGPNTTASDILGAIRGVGKIYSLYVNPPSETHTGTAAKICFFTRAAAEKFFNGTRGGFLVKGYLATVRWNRIRVPEQTIHKDASRVVVIRGPKDIVNDSVIFEVINRNIRFYQLERMRVGVHRHVEGLVEMELHFASFRAQAHSAFIVLNRELRVRDSRFHVGYGADPCE